MCRTILCRPNNVSTKYYVGQTLCWKKIVSTKYCECLPKHCVGQSQTLCRPNTLSSNSVLAKILCQPNIMLATLCLPNFVTTKCKVSQTLCWLNVLSAKHFVCQTPCQPNIVSAKVFWLPIIVKIGENWHNVGQMVFGQMVFGQMTWSQKWEPEFEFEGATLLPVSLLLLLITEAFFTPGPSLSYNERNTQF
jgi:hypothetical protein